MTTAAPTARSPLTFFVLVMGLAVPFWIVGSVLEPPEGVPLSLPWTALMVVCPLIAAAILVSREEGTGGAGRLLRRTLSPRGLEPIWYVPTILLAPGLLALSAAMMRLFRMSLPEPQIALGAVPVLFGLFFVAAVCEEAGWMGYAVDPLQARWGALPTGVVMGLVWTAFHALPWVQVHGPAWAMWQALSTVGLRVLMVWLYNNTAGCVLAAVLFHAMVNLGEALFPNNGSHYDPMTFGVLTALAAALVALRAGAAAPARCRPAEQGAGRYASR